MDPLEIEKVIETFFKGPNKIWEICAERKAYDLEPEFSEAEWEDIFSSLMLELPDSRGYSEPFLTGPANYNKYSTFYKSDLMVLIESLRALFRWSRSLPKVIQFQKKYPSIYHGLCVEYSKIPLLFNDDMYEPVILKWRLKRGL